jgi:hypothetical protein
MPAARGRGRADQHCAYAPSGQVTRTHASRRATENRERSPSTSFFRCRPPTWEQAEDDQHGCCSRRYGRALARPVGCGSEPQCHSTSSYEGSATWRPRRRRRQIHSAMTVSRIAPTKPTKPPKIKLGPSHPGLEFSGVGGTRAFECSSAAIPNRDREHEPRGLDQETGRVTPHVPSKPGLRLVVPISDEPETDEVAVCLHGKAHRHLIRQLN